MVDQRVVQPAEALPLRLVRQVNQQIAAADQIDVCVRLRAEQIVAAEHDCIAHPSSDPIAAVPNFYEEFCATLLGDSPQQVLFVACEVDRVNAPQTIEQRVQCTCV